MNSRQLGPLTPEVKPVQDVRPLNNSELRKAIVDTLGTVRQHSGLVESMLHEHLRYLLSEERVRAVSQVQLVPVGKFEGCTT